MRKILLLALLCIFMAGCHSDPPPTEPPETATENLTIGNPWKEYPTLSEAEAACGLDFPLEETVAGSYKAESFRVLNGELLEVSYRDDRYPVTVRMQAGEGQDLSGVYGEFENISTFEMETHTITNKKIKNGGMVQLISKDGYSWSFYAPNHYWGDSNADFLAFLNE